MTTHDEIIRSTQTEDGRQITNLEGRFRRELEYFGLPEDCELLQYARDNGYGSIQHALNQWMSHHGVQSIDAAIRKLKGVNGTAPKLMKTAQQLQLEAQEAVRKADEAAERLQAVEDKWKSLFAEHDDLKHKAHNSEYLPNSYRGGIAKNTELLEFSVTDRHNQYNPGVLIEAIIIAEQVLPRAIEHAKRVRAAFRQHVQNMHDFAKEHGIPRDQCPPIPAEEKAE